MFKKCLFKKCPNCKNWRSIENYCYKCGAKMKELKKPLVIFCKCGKKILELDDYCTACGKSRKDYLFT